MAISDTSSKTIMNHVSVETCNVMNVYIEMMAFCIRSDSENVLI